MRYPVSFTTMHKNRLSQYPLVLLLLSASALFAAPKMEPAQPLRWQRVTLTFDGPRASETGSPNPFLDFRMSVTFAHQTSGETSTAQGFFAADGDAGNSSAEAGDKWRVRFTPPDNGSWNWAASFRAGSDVALSDSASAGRSAAFDGETETFDVGAAESNAPGFRSKGFLRPVGGHYL